MKMSKKPAHFIAFLLLAITFNTYNMEQQPPRGNNYFGYVAIVGGILLGAVKVRKLIRR